MIGAWGRTCPYPSPAFTGEGGTTRNTSGVNPHHAESLTSSSKARFCFISSNTDSHLTRKAMNIQLRVTIRCRLILSEPCLSSPQPKVQACPSVSPARPASICHCSTALQGATSTVTFQPLPFAEPLLAICMWTASKPGHSLSELSELSEPSRVTVTCERMGHLSVQPYRAEKH